MKKPIQPADSLCDRLQLVAENIFKEAINQPMLFIEAVRYRVAKMRQRLQAKSDLEAFEAEQGLTIRARVKTHGGERVTEGAIKARLHKHPKYRRLSKAYADAEAREEFAKLLLDAYRMRRDAIRIVAESQNYEAVKETAEIERATASKRLSQEARRLYGRSKQVGE